MIAFKQTATCHKCLRHDNRNVERETFHGLRSKTESAALISMDRQRDREEEADTNRQAGRQSEKKKQTQIDRQTDREEEAHILEGRQAESKKYTNM